jgi:hypothetical protein
MISDEVAAGGVSRGFRLSLGGRSLGVTAEYAADVVVLLFIYGFLLSIFTPDLMLSMTITSGGDTASHYYPSKFLRDELLPKGRVIGWLPGWYGGMPLFQYYFPLSFVVIALLSYIIPLQIAFKVVTVLGVFSLPLCAYYCLKLMRFGFPAPAFAATFTLPFLFQESHSMWGGNIPSTLAGEFSYGISLSLTVLFMGAVYRGLKDGRFLLHNAVLLGAVALTHVYTILWVVSSSTFLVLSRVASLLLSSLHAPVGGGGLGERLRGELSSAGRTVAYMAKVYALAFMLSGFWIIPLLARLKYSTSYDLPWLITEDLMPPILWPFALLSALGVLFSAYSREHRSGYLVYSIAVALVFFSYAQKLGVIDIRFLPFVYITMMLLAAYALSVAIRPLRGRWIVPLLVVMLTISWVNADRAVFTGKLVTGEDLSKGLLAKEGDEAIRFHEEQLGQLLNWTYVGYTPYWVKWNYEGFEKKPLWRQFNETNNFIRGGFGDPRAQFEHNDQHNSAGTVRAFESIPLFAGRSILEGLYMQSIITTPFVFYIQSEVSDQQSCPYWAVYPCTSFNLQNGTEHLKMFNTRFIVARSDKLKAAMREDGEWRLAFDDSPYEVWELTTNPDHYVTVPRNDPVLYETSDWKNISYQWFKRMDLIGTPIVFKKDPDAQDLALFKHTVQNPSIGDLESLPATPLGRECDIREKVGAEEIEFTTDCVGLPHIISISYYPSWRVEGADRIYLASPSFMLVYPRENTVRITYGKRAEDWLGIGLTALAFGVLASAYASRDQGIRGFFNLGASPSTQPALQPPSPGT